MCKLLNDLARRLLPNLYIYIYLSTYIYGHIYIDELEGKTRPIYFFVALKQWQWQLMATQPGTSSPNRSRDGPKHRFRVRFKNHDLSRHGGNLFTSIASTCLANIFSLRFLECNVSSMFHQATSKSNGHPDQQKYRCHKGS